MPTIVHVPRRSRRELVVEFAGRAVRFRAAWLASDGSMVLAAECSDEVVLRACRRNPAYSVIEGDPGFLDADAEPKAVQRVAAVLDPTPIPVRAAMVNGWSPVDLLGAGEGGDWGPGGGRSHRSGLTMSEMALSRPPEGWAKAGDTRYPWEVLGWSPPGMDWTAPTAPSKTPMDVESLRALHDGDPDRDADADAADEGEGDPEALADGASDPERDEEPTAPSKAERKPRRAPKAAAGAALSAWSVEDRTRATTLMSSLIAQGTVPSLSKAKHFFKRSNLPPLDEASYQALIDTVPV